MDRAREMKKKLSMVAERELEEGNQEAGIFIEEFLKKEPFDETIAEYIFTSDITTWMNLSLLDDCLGLLASDAAIEWFMLIQSAADEKEEAAGFCKAITSAYHNQCDVQTVQEIYEEIHTVKEFEMALGKMEEKVEAVETEGLEETLLRIGKRLDILDGIGTLSEQFSSFIRVFNQTYEKSLAYQKEAVTGRFQIEQLKKELGELKVKTEKAEQRFQETLGELQEIRGKNEVLQNTLEHQRETVKELLEQNHNLERKLEEEGQQETVSEHCIEKQEVTSEDISFAEEIIGEEFNSMERLGWDMGEVKEIRPDKEAAKERSRFFTCVLSQFYEKEYNKKPLSEQENLLFVKMMELRFSKEKVQAVKKILQGNQGLSRVTLYKFIATNPSEDELMRFCEEAA